MISQFFFDYLLVSGVAYSKIKQKQWSVFFTIAWSHATHVAGASLQNQIYSYIGWIIKQLFYTF